jgi:hypothetical protein
MFLGNDSQQRGRDLTSFKGKPGQTVVSMTLEHWFRPWTSFPWIQLPSLTLRCNFNFHPEVNPKKIRFGTESFESQKWKIDKRKIY